MANDQHSVPYNAVDYLRTPEDCAQYLEAALDDGDERVLLMALRNVSSALKISTESDVKAGQGETEQPSLGWLLNRLHGLGFELTVRPKRAA